MLDYFFVLLIAGIASALALVVLRRAMGPARRRWTAVARVAAVVALSLFVTAYASFRISRTRRFQLVGDFVVRGETREKVVALTFDDGPTPRYADSVLAVLAGEGVRATFFLTGQGMADHPELAPRLIAAGHHLANHSWSHPRMVGLPLSAVRREVEETDRLIRRAGHAGPIYFRAPYSHKLVALPWYLHRTGRTNVSWDVEPDGDHARPADEMVRKALDEVRHGSIILLHPWYASRAETRRALPEMIRALKGRGYRFVTVPELVGGAEG